MKEMNVSEKKYTTYELFYAVTNKQFQELNVAKAQLEQALALLKLSLTYMDNYWKEQGYSIAQEPRKSFHRFSNIMNGKVPRVDKQHWTIDEVTLLLIMLNNYKHKRYSAMLTALENFLKKNEALSEQRIEKNTDWLFDAYKNLCNLKYTNWTKKINIDNLADLNGKKESNREKFNRVKEIEKDIKESRILDNDVDSIIGQILAFCAHPESFLKGRKKNVEELLEAVSAVIYNLQAMEGDAVIQNIAVNETVKKLKNIAKDIKKNYRRSKYYTDNYWASMELTETLSSLEDIKKLVRDKYCIELENIENSII
jgi:hypothetical protein